MGSRDIKPATKSETMKIKELIEKLQTLNPDAKVLLRDQFDDAEASNIRIETDPTTTPKDSTLVMIWGDFN